MRTDHFLDVGSITKQFTAAAILRLAEQGKLSLFDPLEKFFSLKKERRPITLMHLITHRSGIGIPKESVFDQMSKLENTGDAIGYFQCFFDRAPLQSKPGTAWNYNNLTYAALAHIIDRVSGEPFEEFVQREFFRRLALECGFEDGTSVPEDRRTYGHIDGMNTIRAGDALLNLGYRGSTSVVCTARGLSDWTAALMRREVFDKNYSCYFFLDGIPSEYHTPLPDGYSFGWFIESEAQVWHDGSVEGYVSSLELDLKNEISAVVLANFCELSPETLKFALRASAKS